MNDERLISILAVMQWEKCKGELRALIELQGSRVTQYEGNNAKGNREWEKLLAIVDEFIEYVEAEELHN